ncbi:probable UDP-sugar transporter protein SLC35A4 [Haliotis cracherodii]|uniref:probable UDP-sugar transporter protein SLC35A4 n=1 Tax=Haliotis cracherodii TaxID=6455 RepID=UPI0039ED7576
MAQESQKVESECVSFISDDKHVFRPLLWGILLVTEVFIYSSYTILAHLCLVEGKLPFRSSSVIFSTEVLKIVLSIAMMLPELGRGGITMPSLSNCIPFVVPAVLYCINNNLSVYMQDQMDPTTYQVMLQLIAVDSLCSNLGHKPSSKASYQTCYTVSFCRKGVLSLKRLSRTKPGIIPHIDPMFSSTEILYRIILQRKLSSVQWISLGVLSISGILDSYGGMQNKASVWSGEIHLTVTGFLMMCAYCWISGLAGVYTEYILKKQYVDIPPRSEHPVVHIRYVLNGTVWALQEAVSGKEGERQLILQAFNRLIMSAIIKHGSNITRLFIISCAMLVMTLLSVAIFQLALNMYYILAFILVVVALYMYHR